MILYFNSGGKNEVPGFFTMFLLLIESCFIIWLIVFLIEYSNTSWYNT